MAGGCDKVGGAGGANAAAGAGTAGYGAEAAAFQGAMGGALRGAMGGGMQGAMGGGLYGAGGVGGPMGAFGPGSGQGEALMQQAMANGQLQFSGPYAQQAYQVYGDLLDANPDMMQNLANHFGQGGTLSIQAVNSGGPASATQGNSRATVGQQNGQILLDFGDGAIAPGGVPEVAAHELAHIFGYGHTPDMYAMVNQQVARAAYQ